MVGFKLSCGPFLPLPSFFFFFFNVLQLTVVRTSAAQTVHQCRMEGTLAPHGRRTSAARTPETRLNRASMALKVLPETRLKCPSKRRAIVFFFFFFFAEFLLK